MRIVMIVLIAIASSTHAAIVIDSVNIQGKVSMSIPYQVVSTYGQLYSMGSLSGTTSFSITNSVSTSRSITSQINNYPYVPIGYDLWSGAGASASLTAALAVGNGDGFSFAASASDQSGYDVRFGNSSAYPFLTYDIVFRVEQHSAIFSYHQQEIYSFEARKYELYSGTNLIVSNSSPWLADPMNVADLVLLPGTYELKGTYFPVDYFNHNGSSSGAGSIDISITAIPETSSIVFTMVAAGSLFVLYRRRAIASVQEMVR